MDPRHLFFDDRLKTDGCVYCGAASESRDHCPSKVLLDEPFPSDLPVLDACRSCNEAFSPDEQYVACLVECVLCGSTEPRVVHRPKVRRILEENPKLAARIKRSRHENMAANVSWEPELHRVKNVVLKLARGHFAYEFSVPVLEEPYYLNIVPLVSMSESERSRFESPLEDSLLAPWPEMGTRAFLRAARALPARYSNGWIVVQPGRYRYRVGEPGNVDLVLSEYLACTVAWDEI